MGGVKTEILYLAGKMPSGIVVNCYVYVDPTVARQAIAVAARHLCTVTVRDNTEYLSESLFVEVKNWKIRS